jgi:hypothetical protein
MQIYTDKVQLFRKAFNEFRNSEKNVIDYMNFLSRFHTVIKQGSGLTWGTIRSIIEEEVQND